MYLLYGDCSIIVLKSNFEWQSIRDPSYIIVRIITSLKQQKNVFFFNKKRQIAVAFFVLVASQGYGENVKGEVGVEWQLKIPE